MDFIAAPKAGPYAVTLTIGVNHPVESFPSSSFIGEILSPRADRVSTSGLWRQAFRETSRSALHWIRDQRFFEKNYVLTTFGSLYFDAEGKKYAKS